MGHSEFHKTPLYEFKSTRNFSRNATAKTKMNPAMVWSPGLSFITPQMKPLRGRWSAV